MIRPFSFKIILFAYACLFTIPAPLQAGDPGTTFNIEDFGAKGDGVNLNTEAIQKAIDACHAKGGGVVLIPAGRYVTGTLVLKDGVFLRLEKDSELLGSTNARDYLNLDPFLDGTGSSLGYALIVAKDARQIGIEGPGIVDGRGPDLAKAQGKYLIRPFLLRWVRCKELVLKNLQLKNSGAWTCHLFQCDEALIENLAIKSHGLGNNDGIDIDSSQNIQVRNCDIDTGDDSICLKTTSSLPTRNIAVTGCNLKSDWAAIKIGTESVGDFTDIEFSHCQIRDTKGGGVKILSVDGAQVQNITVSDLNMTHVDTPVFLRLGARLKTFRPGDIKKEPGSMKKIIIRNIHAVVVQGDHLKPPTGIFLNGIPGHPIEEVTLENIYIQLPGGGSDLDAKVAVKEKIDAYPELFQFGKTLPAYGLYARHVHGITAKGITLKLKHPDLRPAFLVEDGKETALTEGDVQTVPAYEK